MPSTATLSSDEERLAQLGYKQELNRAWSGFSNFAISFSIISILAGCFTTYGQAWINGGPVAISIGWPLISIMILMVAFSMSELASAMPTAGGIYYWASKLGGAGWGWFTGWFNLIGLVAVTASVDYAAATFLNSTLSFYGAHIFGVNFATSSVQSSLHHTFVLFALILAVHALINIFSSPLVALFTNISVWWHIVGVMVIIVLLVAVPSHHQSFSFVFGHRQNLSGFSHHMYWFYVLPLGFLLTMYTITGYDASAHVSEETHSAAEAAPKGVWRSVFYSAVFGWAVLLALTFAATHVSAINAAGGTSQSIIESALSSAAAKAVLVISTVGQLFCGMACVTSASRMTFAFSRDGAVPGHNLWRQLNRHRTPTWAVVFVAVLALVITIPAYWGNHAGLPVAFLAVTSISVIGLYIAYTIPVFLRWRMGDSFQTGPWTLGRKYRWINPIACAWVALCVVIFCLPFTPAAVPWGGQFSWSAFNYAPLVTVAVMLAVTLWYVVSARHTFKGPVRTIDLPDDEQLAPEPTVIVPGT
ncbi:MAG TPA: amino acid permease [Solirubrobacteraceae bacterium]|nr:amino acid permease [Solirubrobacteraceae bacterium]